MKEEKTGWWSHAACCVVSMPSLEDTSEPFPPAAPPPPSHPAPSPAASAASVAPAPAAVCDNAEDVRHRPRRRASCRSAATPAEGAAKVPLPPPAAPPSTAPAPHHRRCWDSGQQTLARAAAAFRDMVHEAGLVRTQRAHVLGRPHRRCFRAKEARCEMRRRCMTIGFDALFPALLRAGVCRPLAPASSGLHRFADDAPQLSRQATAAATAGGALPEHLLLGTVVVCKEAPSQEACVVCVNKAEAAAAAAVTILFPDGVERDVDRSRLRIGAFEAVRASLELAEAPPAAEPPPPPPPPGAVQAAFPLGSAVVVRGPWWGALDGMEGVVVGVFDRGRRRVRLARHSWVLRVGELEASPAAEALSALRKGTPAPELADLRPLAVLFVDSVSPPLVGTQRQGLRRHRRAFSADKACSALEDAFPSLARHDCIALLEALCEAGLFHPLDGQLPLRFGGGGNLCRLSATAVHALRAHETHGGVGDGGGGGPEAPAKRD